MNRLLQGDVGSGKTLVALFTMLIAIDNGFKQLLWCQPKFLAQQHYFSIKKFLGDMPIKVALPYWEAQNKKKEKVIHPLLENGKKLILL